MENEKRLSIIVNESTNRSVHRAFEDIADQQPDSFALIGRSGDYTYQQIDQAANHIAKKLLSNGAQKFVVTMIEDAFHAITTFLGISKAGFIWIPVYAQLPPPVLKEYIGSYPDSVIAMDSKYSAVANQLGFPTIAIDDIDWTEPIDRISADTDPDSLFGIFPTSGTTGIPKGVIRKHRDQISRTFSSRDAFSFQSGDRFLFITSFAFGSAISISMNCLLVGAEIHLPDPLKQGQSGLINWIVQNQIDYINFMPSTFRYLFVDTSQSFPDVKGVIVGGEPALASDLEIFKRVFEKGTQLVNVYAGTEFGTSSYFLADHDTVLSTATIPVGKAFDNFDVIVEDKDHKPIVGEVGEIVITTREITSGYWKMPDLSAEKFQVVEPASGGDPRPIQIYRSGDLGLMQSDGNLVHMGRADYQVKIRGFRVEISAIENRLFSHPSIKQAVVQPYDFDSDKQLVAFIEFYPNENPPSISQIRQYLAKELPNYSIPTHYTFMEKIPVLTNGKINRRELPDPTVEIKTDSVISAPPTTHTEKTLATIWTKVLKINGGISKHDDIFGMGGTSLKATIFIAEVNSQLGKVLTAEQIYRNPTIAQLASLLDTDSQTTNISGNDEDKTRRIVPLQVYGDKNPIFCIPGSVGNPLMFQPLAQHFIPDFPVYALQPRGSDGQQLPLDNIYEWANYYVEALLAFDIKQPFHLLGHSGGGIIAYEVAQQLKAHDIEVKSVIFGDSHFPGFGNRNKIDSIENRIAAKHFLFNSYRRIKRVVIPSSRNVPLYVTTSVKEIRDRLYRYHHIALRDYQPQPYDGDLVYLFAKISARRTPEQRLLFADKWREVASGNFKVIEFDAPHELMTEPYITAVAQELKQIILASAHQAVSI